MKFPLLLRFVDEAVALAIDDCRAVNLSEAARTRDTERLCRPQVEEPLETGHRRLGLSVGGLARLDLVGRAVVALRYAPPPRLR